MMARPYDIPEKEIEFAAKSGFLSRKIWDEFFNSRSQSASSRRWRGFKSRGLFMDHSSPFIWNCLVLNSKSPYVQELVSRDVSQPPPIAQIYHDELVARIILNLNTRGIIYDGYCLEPELRRMYRENGMRKKYLRLPDAVFDIKSNGKILRVALELELNKKDQLRYKRIIQSYATSSKIDKVIIVYRGRRIRSSFEKLMLKYNYPYHIRPMFFIDMDEVFKKDSHLFGILMPDSVHAGHRFGRRRPSIRSMPATVSV